MKFLISLVYILLFPCMSVSQEQVGGFFKFRAVPVASASEYAFVSQVENSDNDGDGAASIATPAITVTASNLLIAVAAYDFTNAVARTGEITSDPANTWSPLGVGVFDGQYGMLAYYSWNSAGGSTVVTWTPNTSVNYPALAVFQFSGIRSASDPLTGTPVFAQQNTPGTDTDGVTSGNTTPGGQPALIFGFGFDVLGATPAPVAGTGYNSLAAIWNYDGAISVSARGEHKRVTSTSATAATFTAQVNERHFSMVAAFLEP